MSDFFEWDAAKLGLGVPAMDDEHRTLVSRMNELHQLAERGAPRNALAAAVTALIEYTSRHFADEEAYMERIGFPGLRVHRGVHRQLTERLSELHRQFQTDGRLPEDLFVFFKMWLSAHIRGIDTKYAEHAARAAHA